PTGPRLEVADDVGRRVEHSRGVEVEIGGERQRDAPACPVDRSPRTLHVEVDGSPNICAYAPVLPGQETVRADRDCAAGGVDVRRVVVLLDDAQLGVEDVGRDLLPGHDLVDQIQRHRYL